MVAKDPVVMIMSGDVLIVQIDYAFCYFEEDKAYKSKYKIYKMSEIKVYTRSYLFVFVTTFTSRIGLFFPEVSFCTFINGTIRQAPGLTQFTSG